MISKNKLPVNRSTNPSTDGAAVSFPVQHAYAAGIDVGSRSHWVSTGTGKDQQREFGVFTDDLHALCKWLVHQGVKTVAMESTGFYWKQLFVMLQSYDLEAYLVNAAYTKNIRGRKPSDLADSTWIWQLHSVGLLSNSFQPDLFTEELRTYTRHRQNLIRGASQCIKRMQKCLTLMNLHLPIVLSDISGKSGQRMIQAILNGERDANQLARLADCRVKADRATIVRALQGFWKKNYLFELRQHWEHYRFYQQHIKECDEQIDDLLKQQVVQTDQIALVGPEKKSAGKRMHPK